MRAFGKTLGTLTLLGFLVVVVLGWTHAQAIEDWFKLRGYSPPANVAALATEDTMTPLATHIFYVNHPQLESDRVAFHQQCPQAEQTIVLGCYHAGQMGIEVYNVNDPRLHGVQEVTAAHEMLHATYDRLSQSEQNSINQQLLDFYTNNLTDQRVKDTIASYQKSEPNDVVNEMHSVFGTEVANLPAPLESYYKRYFANRTQIVAFANGYEDEFTSRVAQIDADDQQLANLKAQITSEEDSLDSQLRSIQADRGRVENSGSQAEVNSYNARIAAYNSGVRQLRSDIAYYNSLVEKRNALAEELRSLQSSLDTRLTTQ